jgi:hypothetical protein
VSFGIILLIIAVAAIIASIWMTSERDTSRQLRENDRRRQPQAPHQPRPSADFAALIDAIHDETLANRNEEKREDRGQKFRDYATLSILVATAGVLAWTCYAIIQQVGEMQRVYPEVQREAQAAQDQANSVIASERARIFVLPSGINRSSDRDRSPKFPFQIANIGRTAAIIKDFSPECAVVPKGVKDTVPTYNSKKLSPAMSFLGASAILNVADANECILDNPISDDDFAGLAAKTKIILVKGFVRFQDVFGKTWEKRFGMYGFGDGVFFALEGADAFNSEVEIK